MADKKENKKNKKGKKGKEVRAFRTLVDDIKRAGLDPSTIKGAKEQLKGVISQRDKIRKIEENAKRREKELQERQKKINNENITRASVNKSNLGSDIQINKSRKFTKKELKEQGILEEKERKREIKERRQREKEETERIRREKIKERETRQVETPIINQDEVIEEHPSIQEEDSVIEEEILNADEESVQSDRDLIKDLNLDNASQIRKQRQIDEEVKSINLEKSKIKESLFKILTLRRRDGGIEHKSVSTIKIAKIFVGGVLIIAFLSGGFFLISNVLDNTTTATDIVMRDSSRIITSDKVVRVPLDELSEEKYIDVLGKVLSERQILSTITTIIPTVTIQEEERSIEINATTEQFFTQIGIESPSDFTRSLGDSFFLGILTGTENETFIIISIKSFTTASRSLLIWERNIYNSLINLLSLNKNQTFSPSRNLINTQFSDVTLNNQDIREIRDIDGNTIFLYSFIEKNILVIAQSRNGFIKIVDKVKRQSTFL